MPESQTKVEKTQCRCECGYTCNRQCGLEIMECMKTHYTRECEHKWDGAVEVSYSTHPRTGEPYESGGSVTCSVCGMSCGIFCFSTT